MRTASLGAQLFVLPIEQLLNGFLLPNLSSPYRLYFFKTCPPHAWSQQLISQGALVSVDELSLPLLQLPRDHQTPSARPSFSTVTNLSSWARPRSHYLYDPSLLSWPLCFAPVVWPQILPLCPLLAAVGWSFKTQLCPCTPLTGIPALGVAFSL